MSLIANILYPVDFSPSCVAMAAYVKRAAALLGARVSLVHVVDPTGYNGLQLYVRPISEVSEEHLGIGRERLDSFLTAEFPWRSAQESWLQETRQPRSLELREKTDSISLSCPRTRESSGRCCLAQQQPR
jgi:nucleotide-binding universal stress UspA family protein